MSGDRKPILGYEAPDARKKLRRYKRTTVLISVTFAVLLGVAWKCALDLATAHHIRWIGHLGIWPRELIGVAAVCGPLLIAGRLIDRVQKRTLGDEMAAKAAEEQRLLNEEMTATVAWKVPKSAEAADWPKVLFMTAILYAFTFVAVLAILATFLLFNWLIPSRRGTDESMSAFHVAFLCANLVGISGPALFFLALLFLPRAKVTLISDGVLERLGAMKKLIRYSSIHEVCIVPSRRRRSLECVAVLASDERFGQRWHHYDLGHDAPVGEIIKAFESKGFSVATGERN